MRGMKLADILHRMIKQQLAVGFLAFFEFDGPTEFAPPGFREALESAKAKGARGRAAREQAAMKHENEMMGHIATLEHEVATRGRELIDMEKELFAREQE